MRSVLHRLREEAHKRRPRSLAERRRYNIATQDRWRGRAEIAVDLWLTDGPTVPAKADSVSVSDLGAGNELVGRLLETQASYPVAYQAYDLHPQQASTLLLDVREGLPEDHVRVAFALGLIEYLPETDPILTRLAQHAEYLVLSYVELDEQRKPIPDRAALGWVRHQAGGELDTALVRAGFIEIARRSIDTDGTRVRLLRAQARSEAVSR